MVLSEKDVKQITEYVKKEPRTVQDISRLIKRSWITTDSYLKQIKDMTGLIDIKTFRKGTQGALKIAYYNFSESVASDEIKENLFNQLKIGRRKHDFDFMEIFQYIPEKNKKAFIEDFDDDRELSKSEKIGSLFKEAEKQVFCFSGNLSFINQKENNAPILSVIESLVQKKVRFKILCRVNIASINNIKKISTLMAKYPGFIEIKHCYQPLRGSIIDDKIARFKEEERFDVYKKGELEKNTRTFYEIYDPDWIIWLQKVFWNYYRYSMDYNTRVREIKRIF